MKAFITGGSGFLGSHIAEQLVQKGYEVKALVRSTSDTRFLKSLGVTLVEGGLFDHATLVEAMADVDVVVHAAGLVKALKPEEFFHVNAKGAESVFDAAVEAGAVSRFVLVSSLAAHGFSADGRPRDEEAPPHPVTHYGRSKLEGERRILARRSELHVTVIRPPAIYGPRDKEMLVFFKAISRRFAPFMGSAENTLSLVYAEDCARAVVLAAESEQPSGRVYFVEDGYTYTQGQFRKAVERALDVHAVPVPVPVGLLSLVAWFSEYFGRLRGQAVMLTRDKVNELREPYIVCSSARIQRELQWRPETTLEDGAVKTAEWYKNQGML